MNENPMEEIASSEKKKKTPTEHHLKWYGTELVICVSCDSKHTVNPKSLTPGQRVIKFN